MSDGWTPIRAYWEDASPTNREALRAFLKPETTVWQYTHGVTDATRVSPDGYSLDNFYLSRPGADEVQLDLFGDYKSNVALYPTFQDYFRTHKPPFLAVWGKNDPFFLPAGAEAFKRDIPNATVRFFDTGHFALETHAAEIAAAIRDFLPALTPRRRESARLRARGHVRAGSARHDPPPWSSRRNANAELRSHRHRRQPGHRPGHRYPPCARFLRAGPAVARDRAHLDETAAAVKAAGAEALVVDADLSQPSAAQTVVDRTRAAFGRIDALLNIAGAVPQIDLFEMTDEQWGGRPGPEAARRAAAHDRGVAGAEGDKGVGGADVGQLGACSRRRLGVAGGNDQRRHRRPGEGVLRSRHQPMACR